MDSNCGQWGFDPSDDQSVAEYRKELKARITLEWDLAVPEQVPVSSDPVDAIKVHNLQLKHVKVGEYPAGTWFYYPGDGTVAVRES